MIKKVRKISERKSGTVPLYFILFQVLSLYLLFFLLFNLGEKSLWTDEVSSVEYASEDMRTIWKCPDPFHSPLYYAFLHQWLNFVPESDLTSRYEHNLRLPSIIFTVISLWLLFYFLNKIFDIKTAFLICFFFAISPPIYLYSREVRQYSIFLMLSLLSMILLYSFMLKRINQFKIILFIIVSVFAFLFHYAFIFLIPVQMFIVFISTKKKRRWLTIIPLLVPLLIFFVAFKFYPSLWRTIVNNFSATFSEAPYKFIFEQAGRICYVFYVFLFGETIYPWNFYVTIPAVIAFLFLFIGGLVYLYKTNKHKFYSFSVWLFLPIILMCLLTFRASAKYLIFCIVPFYVIIIQGLNSYKWRLTKFLLFAVLVYSSIFSLVNYHTNKQFLNLAYIEPSRDIAKILIKEMLNDDDIRQGYKTFKNDFIVYSPYHKPLQFYLDRFFYYSEASKLIEDDFKPFELVQFFDFEKNPPEPIFSYRIIHEYFTIKPNEYLLNKISPDGISVERGSINGVENFLKFVNNRLLDYDFDTGFYKIWFIRSSPGQIPHSSEFALCSEQLESEFNRMLISKGQANYVKDDDIKLKKMFVNKHFMTYRINIKVFEGEVKKDGE